MSLSAFYLRTLIRAVDCLNVVIKPFRLFSASVEREMYEILGETAGEDSEKLQEETEGCVDEGRLYQQGDQWSDAGECNLKVCHPRGVISVRKCPEWVFKPPCRLEQLDLGVKFPSCCPSVVCPTSV